MIAETSPAANRPRLCGRAFAATALVAALSACGGGGGGGPTPVTPTDPARIPIVDAIRTVSLKFGQPSEFEVTGSNLDGTVSATFGGSGLCSRNSERDSVSATRLLLSCTPVELGTLQLVVSSKASGSTLDTLSEAITDPKVRVVVGSGPSARAFEVTIRAGARGSREREWASHFLYYVNSGFYDGTIFHSLSSGRVIEGGCYDTTLKAKASASASPVTPTVPQPLVAPFTNQAYTISMPASGCADGQLTAFAINLINNSAGQNGDLDKRNYVAIGSYVPAAQLEDDPIYQISTLAPKGGTPQSLPNSPADRASGTVVSLTQIR